MVENLYWYRVRSRRQVRNLSPFTTVLSACRDVSGAATAGGAWLQTGGNAAGSASGGGGGGGGDPGEGVVQVEALALSYGKDDGSLYRAAVVRHASSFLDLATSSHGAAAAAVRDAGVHVAVDLQGHTLGGRLEIIARRVAPIQVNYLIFPGTSGAPWAGPTRVSGPWQSSGPRRSRPRRQAPAVEVA